MKTVKAAGGIIINNQNQIAIVSQFGEDWVLPKGKIDEGESILEAAKREIYEETGLTQLELIKELGSYEHISQGKHQLNNEQILKQVTMFLFTTNQQELAPQDKHNPEAKWIDLDQVETTLSKKAQKDFFQKIKLQLVMNDC